jgi:hypothetical protein
MGLGGIFFLLFQRSKSRELPVKGGSGIVEPNGVTLSALEEKGYPGH